jgi:CubicO group peptidase (beta-lactamase class C family)
VAILLALLCRLAAPAPEAEAAADALFAAYAAPGAPGASILIARGDRILFAKAFGLSNLEAKTPVSRDTKFRLASMTKQFTASAIRILEAEGRLALEDRAVKYLPELPAHAREVTLEHLLTHSSGLPDYEDLIPKERTTQVSDRDALALMASGKALLFPPGSRFQYSNTGYALLALVVEKVSGQSFPDFLAANVFRPLGMTALVPADPNPPGAVPHRAFGYSRAGEGFTRTDQSQTSAVMGDGGVYASAEDLFLWSQALTGNKKLAIDPTKAFAPRISGAQEGISRGRYGYGWFVGEHGGHGVVWHTGSTMGFRNAILHRPDAALTVIVLTNRNEGEPILLARQLLDLYGF